MSLKKSVNIVTVDASADGNDNKFLEKVRDKLEGELTHTSVKDMVDKVLAKLKEGECIGKLEIVGHGDSGLLAVGSRRSGNIAGKRINGGKDEWDDELLRLKDKFCDNAKIVLSGCSVGVCDKGNAKMLEVANLLNVKVCAAAKVIRPSDFNTSGYNQEVTEVSPGDKAGCQKPVDPKRVKKLQKIKDHGASFIDPSQIKAIGYKASGAGYSHATHYPINDKQQIEALFSLVDFETAYDGTGVSSIVNAAISVAYTGNYTDTWHVTLNYQALEIVRHNNFMLFEVKDVNRFKCLLEWMDGLQQNADKIVNNLSGLDLVPDADETNNPLKIFRAEVTATVDKPYRELTGEELLNSELAVIKGIGPATQQHLEETLQIRTIADLAAINVDTRWTRIARNIRILAQREALNSK